MRILSGAVALAALLIPTTAVAAPTALPPVQKRLTADTAAKRICASTLLRASKRGVARTTWKAPMSGFVNVRMTGARRGDWDLAVFDAANRRRMGSSQAFGSAEVVQSWVSSGQRLAIQGCRQSGGRRVPLEVQLIDVAPPKSPVKPSLLSVDIGSSEDLHRLEAIGLDVTHKVEEGRVDVVTYGAKDRNLLEKFGYGFKTKIADLAANYGENRELDALYGRRLAGKSNLPSGSRSSYRKLSDYELEMKQLAAQFPSVVKPVVLPQKTIEGRAIDGVEIASNVKRPEDGRPVYFVVGVHHAREWPAAESAMEFAHLLARGYGNDSRITSLLDRVRVVIVPILNKDGFQASREASETYSPRDRCDDFEADGGLTYDDCTVLELETVEGVPLGGNAAYRRKNCHGIVFPVGTPCELQNGVDPNRNYGEGWGGIGATMNPYGQTYRGTGPWSEPETQAIHEYTRSRQVTNLITIHNVAALVLRPPGRKADGLAPDEPRMREIGDAMAKAAGYTSQYGWQLYDTSGGTEDWNYAAAGTFGYTIEVGPKDGNFHMPYQQGFVDQWTGAYEPAEDGQGMREALMISLESAANPADHSVIEGAAPAGRQLRVRKEFVTKTSPVCQVAIDDPGVDACHAQGDPIEVDDFLESTLVVPKSGRFEWHVTPSTRPFVAARRDKGPVTLKREETFTPAEGEATEQSDRLFTEGDDTDGDGEADRDPQPEGSTAIRTFTVSATDNIDEVVVDLKAGEAADLHDYGTVEDYDMYLYGPDGNGVGTARNDVPPGGVLIWNLEQGQGARIGPFQPEQLIVKDPQPGTYELRVVNRTARGSSWTATVRQFDQEPDIVTPSNIQESWTLTCESRDGKTVYEKQNVIVERGESVDVGNACGGGSAPPAQTGAPGSQGPAGEQGPAGTEGPAGAQGPAGADGRDARPLIRKSSAQKRAAMKAARRKRAACVKKAKKKFKKTARRKAAVNRCNRTYKRRVKRISARYAS